MLNAEPGLLFGDQFRTVTAATVPGERSCRLSSRRRQQNRCAGQLRQEGRRPLAPRGRSCYPCGLDDTVERA